jgi:hypothetical protein
MLCDAFATIELPAFRAASDSFTQCVVEATLVKEVGHSVSKGLDRPYDNRARE